MAQSSLTPTCVWRITPELVISLDERFGEPVDAYVNGSQVWLREDGPDGMMIEWRLHPVAGYQRPPMLTTYDVFPTVALSVARGDQPPAPPEALWDGLEAFAAYGDEIEPAALRASVFDALGLLPDASGLADHKAIGDQWEQARGQLSIVHALLDQLSTDTVG